VESCSRQPILTDSVENRSRELNVLDATAIDDDAEHGRARTAFRPGVCPRRLFARI